MIEFHLNARSGVPTYLQLVQQVEHALRLGYLEPGDQLPTVRAVVERLAINPNTVLKAYRELEHQALVAGRPGQGTFVLRSLGGGGERARQMQLRRGLERWMRGAYESGMHRDGIAALFATVLDGAGREEAG